ncbi:tetratricopeptide repeat protein [Desulfotalea psychrophila]|uniref:Related to peroxisomal targeting signal type 1 receptor n=1 Tax=Desulfotalea psychrophila (strain LSv54 / DSM 12343) TaxID=177439 RepID=Q6ANV1_DESPS|nr:tetratricopeptide repeat protein [Desulfotalea psychrophila]CAG35973.1 related to peroxisomal targeting signal type 1 receptor [Desulfotalea psychrophila LSv54]
MKTTKNSPNHYLVWAFIFICGFISGVGISVYKLQPQLSNKQIPSTAKIPAINHEQLHKLEELVKDKPEDLDSWIQLSHMYFDSNQHKKAIAAYKKSILLKPNDAALWTDLGVMYRRNEQAQKAIDSFNKAIAINPKHETALFNRGIVLLYDLNQRQQAIASFEELLRVNPEAQSSNGGKVSEFVEYLKTEETVQPAQ